jgi:hypothetical protein
MTGQAVNGAGWLLAWRILRWGGAAGLLLLPLVAMQFTDEVDWTLSDFVFAGVVLLAVSLAYEVLDRRATSLVYRAAAVMGVGTLFVMVWVNAAVGIIGEGANSANLAYGGVLLVAVAGAILARLRPAGMARAAAAAAAGTAAIGAYALATGVGGEPPLMVAGVTAFFTVPWLLSAALFWWAAKAEAEAEAGA